MKNSIIIVLLLICSKTWGQEHNSTQKFNNANNLYEQKQFVEALNGYLELEHDGLKSDHLFYNMGNTYYNLNQRGNAILYYEKALLLNPDSQKAMINLKYAQKPLEGKITKIVKLESKDILYGSLNFISFNTWAKVATLLSLCALVFFCFYYYNSNTQIKRIVFICTLLCVLGLSFSMYAAYTIEKYEQAYKPAIVMLENVELKEQAIQSSKAIMELQEGTKVLILDEKALWYQVKLENQDIGWLLKKSIRSIK